MDQFAILDLGTPQLIIILVIILLLFGSKKLPELSRSLGNSVSELRKGFDEGPDDKKKAKSEAKKEAPSDSSAS